MFNRGTANMRMWFMLLLTLGVVGATPVPAPTQVAASVPRGTVIYVTVLKDVRIGGEGTNNETHKLKMEVTQDIILNGVTIAKAGDLAEGEYTRPCLQTCAGSSYGVS
jgi:hypothetical protein